LSPSGVLVCAVDGGAMPGICALAQGSKIPSDSVQNTSFFTSRERITV